MKLLFTLTTFLITVLSFAQQKQHKIVFDFSSSDTASFSTMIRQANSIMKAAPNSKLEIVCHGPGIGLILKDKSTVQQEIQELQKLNVVFAACEGTMRRMGIDKSQLLPKVVPVPLASLEISSREQEGWSYIKAGQ